MTRGNLQYQFANLGIAGKLIVVNVVVFLVNLLVPVLLQLPKDSVERWFWIPDNLTDFIGQPWSLVTYSFFHASFGHIFFNMLVLFFAARIFLNLFGNKRFINVYFLGVIMGGLLFLLVYTIFPGIDAGDSTIVIGASAGVRAVLIFICAYIPNREVRLIFFNLKLWYLGVFLVSVDIMSIILNSNMGGNIAHIGGSLLGYAYANQLAKGTDIGAGFSKFLDGLGNFFKKKEKKAPLKTVYRKNKHTGQSKDDYNKATRQRKIDAILDKISKSGYESLSKTEKDFLFKAGKED